MPQLISIPKCKLDSIPKETAKFGWDGSERWWDEFEEMNMTEKEKEEEWLQPSSSRLQDLLMPGLRHAHTLQQLEEYNNSPS